MPELRRRSVAIAVGAVAVAVSAAPVTTSYADVSCTGSSAVNVTVVGDIQASEHLSPQDVCDMYDVHRVQYYLRARPGTTATQTETSNDLLSIQKLVGTIPTGPGSTLPLNRVSFVQITGQDGRAHSLDKQQVTQPETVFTNGLEPALWFEQGPDAMWYIRPLMGADDVNVTDKFPTLSGQPLQIVVHTKGQLLHPSITATPDTVDAGEPVAFSVSFSAPQPTGTVHYRWTFSDGTTSRAAAPHHRFTSACTCGAHLDVTTDDTSSGSADVSVQVGPKPTQSPSPTGPTQGPTNPGGNHQGGPTAGPSSLGPSTGPTTSASPSVGPGPSSTAVPSDGTTSVPTKARGNQAKDGDEVSGRLLLAGAVYVPPQTSSVTRAASVRPPNDPGRNAWWTLSLLVPLLIGTGMAAEVVQVRRRVARMGA